MKLNFRIVDAFTEKAFAGNSAGVCLLESPIDDSSMQKVASEINSAETAFLVMSGNRCSLRWFTPAVEIALCGHATLASAHVLWTENRVRSDEIIYFDTKSGELTAKQLPDGWIQLNFPAISSAPIESPRLAAAIGATPTAIAMTHHTIIAELSSEQEVRDIKPDFAAILALGVHGVIVTSASSGKYDFVSRFFAPAVGINEDPVTGSAHCALGPYWQKRFGRSEFLAYQASARGGEMRVTVVDKRVLLEGKAVTTITGVVNFQ